MSPGPLRKQHHRRLSRTSGWVRNEREGKQMEESYWITCVTCTGCLLCQLQYEILNPDNSALLQRWLSYCSRSCSCVYMLLILPYLDRASPPSPTLSPPPSPGLLCADISAWHNMKKCWEIKNWSLLSAGLVYLLLVCYGEGAIGEGRRESLLWEGCARQKLFQGFRGVKVREASEGARWREVCNWGAENSPGRQCCASQFCL